MKARIMLVEDEPDIREEIAEYLGFCGYDVTTAADGKEALSQLTAQPVDLVIADELMPNLTGLQLLARLRAMDQLRDMPVIIVSAWMADRCVFRS